MGLKVRLIAAALLRLAVRQRSLAGRLSYGAKAVFFGPLVAARLLSRPSGPSSSPHEAGGDIYPIF